MWKATTTMIYLFIFGSKKMQPRLKFNQYGLLLGKGSWEVAQTSRGHAFSMGTYVFLMWFEGRLFSHAVALGKLLAFIIVGPLVTLDWLVDRGLDRSTLSMPLLVDSKSINQSNNPLVNQSKLYLFSTFQVKDATQSPSQNEHRKDQN